MEHRSTEELAMRLGHFKQTPSESGTVEMIVRRPGEGEREEIESGEISVENGLVGDNWRARGNPYTEDGLANPEAQITLMNSRYIEFIAGGRDRWALAGDQFYVDFDLSEGNLPAGTKLSVGSAIVEVSATPHTGCQKFTQRFGFEARRFVNSTEGKALRLRGVNTRVIQAGSVAVGDVVKKV